MPSLRDKSHLVQKITIIKYLLQQKGGIEKRFQNYLEEFLRRGYRITVLYGSEKDSYRRIQGIEYKKVSVGAMPSRSLRKIYFAFRVRKMLKSVAFSDQLTLSMGRTGPADIVIAAGNYPETSRKDILGSTWFRNPMYYLDKVSFKDCRLIFAASTLVKQEIMDLFHLSERRVRVLFPPVRIGDFKQLDNTLKKQLSEKFDIDPSRKNFLFVSTGHKRKGLSFLIDIFSKLDPDRYMLYVAGSKFDSDLPNVKYLGYVENTNELYNIMDCLLHPASYEAFGQVITESLICGLPVIVSDRVGAKEIVHMKNGSVLPYNDREAWKEGIEKFEHTENIDGRWMIDNLNIEAHVNRMLKEWSAINGKVAP